MRCFDSRECFRKSEIDGFDDRLKVWPDTSTSTSLWLLFSLRIVVGGEETLLSSKSDVCEDPFVKEGVDGPEGFPSEDKDEIADRL